MTHHPALGLGDRSLANTQPDWSLTVFQLRSNSPAPTSSLWCRAPTPSQQFDLPHRAGLAINCLTRFLDERQDYLPHFNVFYGAHPPVATHIRWDYGDCVGRYIEALKLTHIMSGQTQGLHADAALQRWLERLLGEHGLSWWPDPSAAGGPEIDSI